VCHGWVPLLLLLLCCASDCDGAHVAKQSVGCSSTVSLQTRHICRPLLVPAGSCPVSGLPANPPLFHFIYCPATYLQAMLCSPMYGARPLRVFVAAAGTADSYGRSDAAVVLTTLLLANSVGLAAIAHHLPATAAGSEE
jgi:hypothetical protein